MFCCVPAVPGFYITSHKLQVCNSVERALLQLESGSTPGYTVTLWRFPHRLRGSGERSSHLGSNGCLTSERMLSCVFVSVTEVTFRHESGRRFQRLERETGKNVSDPTPRMWVCLLFVPGFLSVRYLCTSMEVFVYLYSISYAILRPYLQSEMTFCL